MTKLIYHLISDKFSQFQALSSHFVKKIENYLVPFWVSRSYMNKVEIMNKKDVYLPHNTSNNNVCALFLAGHHFFCM